MAENRYLLGQGKIYISERDPDTGAAINGYRFLGNVPTFKISTSTQEVSHFESYTGQQLEDLSIETRKSATLMLTLEDFSRENLGLALFGQTNVINAGTTVSGEQHKVYKGRSFPLNNINLSAFGSLSIGGSTVSANNNYTVDLKSGMVSILPNATNITDGQTATVSYTNDGMEQINTYAKPNAPYLLRFNGINLVDNKPVVADIFKARFKPQKEWDLINNNTEVSKIDLDGKILYDPLASDGGFLRIRFGV